MAALLGLFTGVLAFIPNIGAIVSGVLMVAVGFSRRDRHQGLWAIFVYFFVQNIDGYLVVPYRAPDGRPRAGPGAGGAAVLRRVVRVPGAAAGRPDRRDAQGDARGAGRARATRRSTDARSAPDRAAAERARPRRSCALLLRLHLRRAASLDHLADADVESRARLLGGRQPGGGGSRRKPSSRGMRNHVAAAFAASLQRFGEARHDLRRRAAARPALRVEHRAVGERPDIIDAAPRPAARWSRRRRP